MARPIRNMAPGNIASSAYQPRSELSTASAANAVSPCST
ncbi:Uncharacterised protein [Bordetella pertussis]|nr:Uncharacterised protein [Bordetella pertussis]CFP68302.1 Uncharacterised protein [Bordetella pertussis]